VLEDLVKLVKATVYDPEVGTSFGIGRELIVELGERVMITRSVSNRAAADVLVYAIRPPAVSADCLSLGLRGRRGAARCDPKPQTDRDDKRNKSLRAHRPQSL